jgi:putative addiction module killer protein
MEILAYLDHQGRSPFQKWFDDLDSQVATRVSAFIVRLSLGNVSNVASVGAGVLELKMDFAKGFRVYFGKDGDMLVILLGGGTKQRQQDDIAAAQERWLDYKARKKGEM